MGQNVEDSDRSPDRTEDGCYGKATVMDSRKTLNGGRGEEKDKRISSL